MRFFVHLYRKGWIYRANRIINWCPHHQTALSDLELVHEEVDDALTYVRYPFADDPDGGVTIATARPATILADVAVAVAPGRRALARRDRARGGRAVRRARVPVIADERVDTEFGTGALKVTPGARPARLRDRPRPRPARADGDRPRRPDERASGRARRARRRRRPSERILAWIKERGLLVKREAYRHSVARCERCNSRIEPLISLQWWCAMDELKQPALAALRRRPRALPPASRSTASRSTRSRTRPTGTSRARSGGATRSRSGSARTGT